MELITETVYQGRSKTDCVVFDRIKEFIDMKLKDDTSIPQAGKKCPVYAVLQQVKTLHEQVQNMPPPVQYITKTKTPDIIEVGKKTKFKKKPEYIEDLIDGIEQVEDASSEEKSLKGHDVARTVSGFQRKGTIFQKKQAQEELHPSEDEGLEEDPEEQEEEKKEENVDDLVEEIVNADLPTMDK